MEAECALRPMRGVASKDAAWPIERAPFDEPTSGGCASRPLPAHNLAVWAYGITMLRHVACASAGRFEFVY